MAELDPELQRKIDAFQERKRESDKKDAEETRKEEERIQQAYLDRRRRAEEIRKK